MRLHLTHFHFALTGLHCETPSRWCWHQRRGPTAATCGSAAVCASMASCSLGPCGHKTVQQSINVSVLKTCINSVQGCFRLNIYLQNLCNCMEIQKEICVDSSLLGSLHYETIFKCLTCTCRKGVSWQKATDSCGGRQRRPNRRWLWPKWLNSEETVRGGGG